VPTGPEELYEHRDDPHERKNAANDPIHAQIKREHCGCPRPRPRPRQGSTTPFLNRTVVIWYWEKQPIDPGERFD